MNPYPRLVPLLGLELRNTCIGQSAVGSQQLELLAGGQEHGLANSKCVQVDSLH